jgi:cysteine desulfurase
MELIYLDYNATTPVDPRVADTMLPYLSGCFGNPSSDHRLGIEARQAVSRARAQVASCIGAQPDEIIFTSGGSESNNLAIQGVLAATGGGHMLTSAVEHPAVLEVVRAMAARDDCSLTVLDVDRYGRVDPAAVEAALQSNTVLVSLMLANNEVGTLQPVAEVAAICHRHGVLMHTDAAQAVGKIAVDVAELGIDLLSVAGHKLYGPKGIGALYIRSGVGIEPLIRGASHERGLRAGTENVLGQVGLGAACKLVQQDMASEHDALCELRDRLQEKLCQSLPGTVVHGHPQLRLPNTVSAAFSGVDAGRLLADLGDRLAASAGAACHSHGVTVSHVLAAMGVDADLARSTIRLSVGRFTTEQEIDASVALIVETCRTS